MNNCFLSHWLHSKLDAALVRFEFAEVNRLQLEIKKHDENCLTCAMQSEALIANLFGDLKVVVLHEE